MLLQLGDVFQYTLKYNTWLLNLKMWVLEKTLESMRPYLSFDTYGNRGPKKKRDLAKVTELVCGKTKNLHVVPGYLLFPKSYLLST